MALEEIERLKERVNKDPNSKLFVPLAEEYKKIGMISEAIETLMNGLEKHPSYMSAHVSLGKIYLDKGKLDQASSEFEKVVSAIPDNLYAHKKLAEIYRALSMRENAIEEFKVVLKLNPLDWDAEKNLALLEEGVSIQPEVVETVKSTVTEEKPAEVAITDSFEELTETPFQPGEKIVETKEEGELFETLGLTSEDIPGESDFAMEEISETLKKEIPEESPTDLSVADSCVSQGRYAEALNMYKSILAIEPDNVHVHQRLEELKTLLELLGKGKEDLIAKMNNLLNGIRRRRDEFFKTLQ
jgi:tetratricopeptide (TPR) repeat protein